MPLVHNRWYVNLYFGVIYNMATWDNQILPSGSEFSSQLRGLVVGMYMQTRTPCVWAQPLSKNIRRFFLESRKKLDIKLFEKCIMSPSCSKHVVSFNGWCALSLKHDELAFAYHKICHFLLLFWSRCIYEIGQTTIQPSHLSEFSEPSLSEFQLQHHHWK